MWVKLSSGDGLRLRHDLLEEASRLEPGRGLAEAPRDAAGRAARGGQDRLARALIDSSLVRARGGGGRTGPSPVDRRKRGSKHQIITAAGGIPLVADTTAANVPDVNPMIPLVDAIPPVRGKPGRPRRRPASLYGDRGYDSDPHRRKLLPARHPSIHRATADAAWERAGNVSLVRGADAVVVAQLREAASSQG